MMTSTARNAPACRRFQCLFTGIRLGDQQLIDIHPVFGVNGIQRVLRIDEGANLPLTLCF